MPFAPIDDAIAAIGRGEIVIVVDDEDRENEGDLIIAAEKMTPEKMAFMIRYTSGVICMPLEGDRLDDLNIPLMVANVENTEVQRTAFTVSVDYRHDTTTGISATDRAATVAALLEPTSRPADFARPGHIFPLRYRPGGVLRRAGHTEASVDLARLAGCYAAGVLAEVVNDDGSMARLPQLEVFAAEHNLIMISIADLVRYRRREEKLVRRVADARIPTEFGDFTAHVFESIIDDTEHVAFVMGSVAGQDNVLVRMHSECLTGDVFGSLRCDCGPQLNLAMARVAAEGSGVVVYLRGHEGRGIGLGHKLRAYTLQEQGRDTVEANLELGFPVDSREYGIGAQILVDLGVSTMRLMTNNMGKIGGLEGYGLKIVERIPLLPKPNVENLAYLRAKQHKLGHLLHIDDTDDADLRKGPEPSGGLGNG
jgi:3,4-dihydroxy 2-butanone 4-phosphate synthase/GTP cyclohydrolase II